MPPLVSTRGIQTAPKSFAWSIPHMLYFSMRASQTELTIFCHRGKDNGATRPTCVGCWVSWFELLTMFYLFKLPRKTFVSPPSPLPRRRWRGKAVRRTMSWLTEERTRRGRFLSVRSAVTSAPHRIRERLRAHDINIFWVHDESLWYCRKLLVFTKSSGQK